MIEIKVTIERDILDKETNLTTTIGSEEIFVLPDKFNAVDKFTLIRDVRDYLEKGILPHNEDALPEDHLEDIYGEHWGRKMKANNIKAWNPIAEGEAYMLINHCIERLPEMKEGFVTDCIDEGHVTISFESPKYILTLKLEKKDDKH